MSFIEQRLDLGITYGTTSTITTSTAIVEDFSGAEQRSINWSQPLLKFNIGSKGALNAELEYFIEFHRARKGAYEGFRFKDWSDWRVTGQAIGIGDGVKTQFQLYKSYSVANHTVNRPITKPVAGTVTIYVDGVESAVTVNTATGVVTFGTAPTGAITADFEFDVPVRFERDKIDLRFEAFEKKTGRKLFNWEGLALVEVRIPSTIPLLIDPIPSSLDHTIDLGYDYGTIGGNEFATRIDKLVSGHEKRTADRETPRGSWEIGQRTLDLSELEYLIALFRVCRGRGVGFRYFDRAEPAYRPVRFGEDAIAFQFRAYERGTGKVIFNLSGVPIVARGDAIARPDNATENVYIGLTAATGLAGINPTGSRHRILAFTLNDRNLMGDLQLNGNASFVGGILQLTPAANSQAGSAFYRERLTAQDWQVRFTYEIIQNSRYDGIAFVVTNSTSGLNSLTPGGGIGYLGISPRVAVEFDIFQNSEFGDPNNNHVAINAAGRETVNEINPSPGIDLVGTRHVWIDYLGGVLSVYLSEGSSKPGAPILERAIEIDYVLGIY